MNQYFLQLVTSTGKKFKVIKIDLKSNVANFLNDFDWLIDQTFSVDMTIPSVYQLSEYKSLKEKLIKFIDNCYHRIVNIEVSYRNHQEMLTLILNRLTTLKNLVIKDGRTNMDGRRELFLNLIELRYS